jgi:serine/threonine-protein kinase TTK/MPS1
MLQAVHVIHEEKIVHSDLKPANFVLVRGQLKLIDFGIANAIANDTTNIQRDHQVSMQEERPSQYASLTNNSRSAP